MSDHTLNKDRLRYASMQELALTQVPQALEGRKIRFGSHIAILFLALTHQLFQSVKNEGWIAHFLSFRNFFRVEA